MGAENSCGSGEESLVEICENLNENIFGDYNSLSIRGISWPAEELRPLISTVTSKIRCETETRFFFFHFHLVIFKFDQEHN